MTLNTTRDLRDVRAYWSLIDKGHIGEIYNICSGIERNISHVSDELISMSDHSIEVESNSIKFRKHNLQRIKGSLDKINQNIGWRPQIDLSTTLWDLLMYWVDKLTKEHN